MDLDKIVKDIFVPIMDNDLIGFADPSEVNPEYVELAGEELKNELIDKGRFALQTPIIIVIVLFGISEFLYPLPLQAYGLALILLANSLLLAGTGIFGRHTIAKIVESNLTGLGGVPAEPEATVKRYAKITVMTGIALLWLFCGLLIQFIAVTL